MTLTVPGRGLPRPESNHPDADAQPATDTAGASRRARLVKRLRADGDRPPLWREVLLLGSLLALYNAGRLIAAMNVGRAYDNADSLLNLEHFLHLPREQSVQSVLLRSRDLTQAANWFYAHVHFPLTAAVLVWLWLRRPSHYLWARRALPLATLVGLVLMTVMPTAPPRLTGHGFVDTGKLYGQSVYGDVGHDKLANQFAAMPSLHVGWALLVAVLCISASKTAFRWLWVLHPVVTLLVVVSTANHYWLDGAVGALLVAAALVITRPDPAHPETFVAKKVLTSRLKAVPAGSLSMLSVAMWPHLVPVTVPNRTIGAPPDSAASSGSRSEVDP